MRRLTKLRSRLSYFGRGATYWRARFALRHIQLNPADAAGGDCRGARGIGVRLCAM